MADRFLVGDRVQRRSNPDWAPDPGTVIGIDGDGKVLMLCVRYDSGRTSWSPALAFQVAPAEGTPAPALVALSEDEIRALLSTILHDEEPARPFAFVHLETARQKLRQALKEPAAASIAPEQSDQGRHTNNRPVAGDVTVETPASPGPEPSRSTSK